MVNHRRVCRPKKYRTWGLDRFPFLHEHAGLPLLLGALALLLLCFYLIPRFWVERNEQIFRSYSLTGHTAFAHEIQLRATRQINIRGFDPADPDHLERLARHYPLVKAIVIQRNGDVFARNGDSFQRLSDGEDAARFRRWAESAHSLDATVWHPPEPEFQPLREAYFLLRQRFGYAICRWGLGEAEAEAFLRNTLGQDPGVRVALARTQAEERPERPPALGAMAIQTAIPRKNDLNLVNYFPTSLFGKGWSLVIVGSEDEQAVFRRWLIWWHAQAYAVCVIIFLFFGSGFYFIHRAKVRERMDHDLLASMTHSLKTPLSVLMLRCDSIRLGQFTRERQGEELAIICTEVKALTGFIDQSLKGLDPCLATLERTEIGPQWFQDILSDLKYALAEEGRTLEVVLAKANARAHPESLRSALATLLDNAMYYGVGTVRLDTSRRGPWLRVQVSNQGQGLSAGQLAQIGKPFQRLSSPAGAPNGVPGHGIGLFLLKEMATQLGWGLEFSSEEGKNFVAALEIPAV